MKIIINRAYKQEEDGKVWIEEKVCYFMGMPLKRTQITTKEFTPPYKNIGFNRI